MSDEQVDVLVVGGGITGAAVLHEVARRGARALLVERGDYASGTSAWSSKLIHGGARYLSAGQWRMTLESVREREALLRERPALVTPQHFVLPIRTGDWAHALAVRVAMLACDLMAGQTTSRRVGAAEALQLEPLLTDVAPGSAISYRDGVVDDARFVLALLREAREHGARTCNYTKATLTEADGRVTGATLVDHASGATRTVRATVTVHAAGAWAGAAPGAPRLRPLRGSHLVFAARDLPLRSGMVWLHPRDRRPVFAHCWLGAVIVGTTDVEHADVNAPAVMSLAERDYLMEALHAAFPSRTLTPARAISCFAGLRAIVMPPGARDAPPSRMARDMALWTHPGFVGTTGGKLTTHRVTARAVLREVSALGVTLAASPATPLLPVTDRLTAALGDAGASWVRAQPLADRAALLDTPFTMAELAWSLHHEQVTHLDDLLLRRTRVGLLVPHGGAALLGALERPCGDALGGDASRFRAESERYRAHWRLMHDPLASGAAR